MQTALPHRISYKLAILMYLQSIMNKQHNKILLAKRNKYLT